MKVGYSTSLSEVVAAHEVEYGDCASFQITCPVCRAAVFKTVRTNLGQEQTHFFSHYRADSEEAKLCELRVASLAESVLRQWTIEGRQQTLKMFLSVLRSEVYACLERDGVTDRVSLQKAVGSIMSRPDFRPTFNYLVKACTKAFEFGEDLIVSMISCLPVFGGRSKFWIRRQAAYVHDVGLHLRNEQARKNMEFLVAVSIWVAESRPDSFGAFCVFSDAVYAENESLAKEAISALARRKSSVALKKLLSRRAPGLERAYQKGQEVGRESVSGKGGPLSVIQSDFKDGRISKTDALSRIMAAGPDARSVKDQVSKIEADMSKTNSEFLAFSMMTVLQRPIFGVLASIPFPDISGRAIPGSSLVQVT